MIVIYIAGKYTAKARLKEHRAQVQASGFDVSSSWLDTNFPEVIDEDRMANEAVRDCQEVEDAGVFILDTIDESMTGGREVELGIALTVGASILHVGPKRNVFHYLPMVQHFEDWDAVIAHLRERK